ncbi:MAG: hypothetical protein ACR2O1_15585, partial [Boseongicola sp.]
VVQTGRAPPSPSRNHQRVEGWIVATARADDSRAADHRPPRPPIIKAQGRPPVQRPVESPGEEFGIDRAASFAST